MLTSEQRQSSLWFASVLRTLDNYISLPAVAAAATARATANVFEKAPAPAPELLVRRTARQEIQKEESQASAETLARPAAMAYFEQESSVGTREACVEIKFQAPIDCDCVCSMA